MPNWIWMTAMAAAAACGPMYGAASTPPGAPPPSGPPGMVAPGAAAPGAAPGAAIEDPPAGADPDDSASGAPVAPAAYPSDPPAAEPAAAGHGSADGDAAAWVDAHNRVRAKHCAGPLSWSTQLAAVAQRWANALRDRGCMFGHSGGQYGENLAAGTVGTLDPAAVVQMWYDEVAEYHFPDGGFSMKTGHFTQVVWRGTKRVGCGHSRCKGMDILVCEYDPAGNWEGQYRENVLPRGCRAR